MRARTTLAASLILLAVLVAGAIKLTARPAAGGDEDQDASPVRDIQGELIGTLTIPAPPNAPVGGGVLPAWIRGLAVSPDGRKVCIASVSRGLEVWAPSSPGEDAVLEVGPTDIGERVAWSPDGRQIASCGALHPLSVYDSTTRQKLWNVPSVTGVAWSPNGREIACCDAQSSKIVVRDAATGGVRRTLGVGTGPVGSCEWSPDGEKLAVLGADYLVIDASSGATIASITGGITAPGVQTVVWSPDSANLAAGSAAPIFSRHSFVLAHSATSGELLQNLARPAREVQTVVWSPGGNYVAFGDVTPGNVIGAEPGHLAVHQFQAGRLAYRLVGPGCYLFATRWLRNPSQCVAAASAGDRVELWRWNTTMLSPHP